MTIKVYEKMVSRKKSGSGPALVKSNGTHMLVLHSGIDGCGLVLDHARNCFYKSGDITKTVAPVESDVWDEFHGKVVLSC